MTWAKIDDSFPDHPKIVAAGPICALLQIRAICYCCRYLTDGLIPEGAVSNLLSGLERISIAEGMVGDGEGGKLAEWGRDASSIDWAEVMVQNGLWQASENGYRVHDFLDYNPSKKDVERERKQYRERAQKGAKARWNKDGQRHAYKHASSNANSMLASSVNHDAPVPVPVPVPLTTSTSTAATEFHTPDSILGALQRAPRLGSVNLLLEPRFWQAELRANPGVDFAAEVLKAEAWIAANPRKAPTKDLPRFLHNWLGRADR